MLKSLLRLDDDVEEGAGAAMALPTTPAELIADCRSRAGVYRLLSGAFVEEPGSEFLAALREPQALAELAAAGIRFDADFLETPLDELVEMLAIEYTTQFAATGGFPPVESVRLTGRYKQEPNFAVMQTYRRCGFELRRGRFEVFADQLGVELMFIAGLLERAATAVEQGDLREHGRLEKEIKRFWTLHLGRWVRGYSRLIENTAEHSFFRGMARLLDGFAAEEIEAMGLRIEDADQARLVVPKSEARVEFNPDEPVCNGCVSDALPGTLTVPDSVQRLEDMRGPGLSR